MADSISTRVLIAKKKNRVIYAEADEDFLNILFSLLTIPIGTLIRLTSTNNSPTFRIGSTNNLYKSVEDIDARCFQTEDHEAMLLISPRNGAEFQCKSVKLNVDAMPTIDWEVNLAMPQDAKQYKYHDPFLKRFMARFTITDDLQVMPVSAVERFSFFAKHGIADQRAPLRRGLSLFRENMSVQNPDDKWFTSNYHKEILVSQKLAYGFGYKNDLGVEEGPRFPYHHYVPETNSRCYRTIYPALHGKSFTKSLIVIDPRSDNHKDVGGDESVGEFLTTPTKFIE
ncbi:hypothetical protein TIFTF001_000321 [Ficus carica]|uniref:Uncharacterized protein n=1 Tax=Ficus carica TaxID=3494 RepID=A0AA87Z9Q5_FICCA|nr:hypothetical protein TIFTF001_000321 [Ficus carica]